MRFFKLFLILSTIFATVLSAEELQKVTLQLKWKHQFQFAGYYAAIEKGYYKEAGLDVSIVEAKSGVNPALEVTSGRAEFGVGNSELLLHKKRGDDVVVLAVIMQHSPLAIALRKSSDSDSVHSLVGKNIMMEQNSAELMAYLIKEDIPLSKLNILPHSFDTKDLISGKVNAMSIYTSDEQFALKKARLRFLLLEPRDDGIDFYGDNLFTTAKTINEKPRVVKAFREASLRGWEYAMTHKEEIIALILQKYGNRHSKEHLIFEANQMDKLMQPVLIKIGHMEEGRWRYIANTYAEQGLLPKEFSLKDFIYDPNPSVSLQKVYGAAYIIGSLFVMLILASGYSIMMNRKLKKEIGLRKDIENVLHSINQDLEKRVSEEIRLRMEKEQLLNQQSKMAAMGEMLAIITHQWKQPLNIIGLCAQELEVVVNDDPNVPTAVVADVVQAGRDIYSQIKFMASTIDDFRNFLLPSKSKHPFSAAEAIDVVLRLFGQMIERAGVSIEKNASGEPSALLVLGYENEFKHVLLNIITNARDAILGKVEREGCIKIECYEKQDMVCIDISDNGGGISPENIERIFEYHFTTKGEHGTGIGLYMAKSIIEDGMGGKLSVQNEDAGAKFTIALKRYYPERN